MRYLICVLLMVLLIPMGVYANDELPICPPCINDVPPNPYLLETEPPNPFLNDMPPNPFLNDMPPMPLMAPTGVTVTL